MAIMSSLHEYISSTIEIYDKPLSIDLVQAVKAHFTDSTLNEHLIFRQKHSIPNSILKKI